MDEESPLSQNEEEEAELTETQKLMRDELKRWEALGVDPSAWKPHEGFIGLVVRFELMDTLLQRAGIYTEEDAQELWEEIMLRRLTEIREAIAPGIQQARLAAIKQGIVPGFPFNGTPGQG